MLLRRRKRWNVLFLSAFLFFLAVDPVWADLNQEQTNYPFCFVQISDSHIDEKDEEGNLFSEKLKELTAYFNQTIRPAFIIHTGDTVTQGHRASFSKYQQIISASRAAVYTVPGNHDASGVFQEFLNIIGPEEFSLWVQDYHFVGANISDNENIDFGGLADELAQAPGKTLIFAHLPVEWPSGYDHDNLNMKIENRDEIGFLMAQNQTLAYFTGHLHRPFTYYGSTRKIRNIGVGAAKFGEFRLICLDEARLSSVNLDMDQIKYSPLVIITAPEEYLEQGQWGKVNGLVRIKAKTYSNSPLFSVQYKIDEGQWFSLLPTGTQIWEAVWNTAPVSLGKHQIKVKVIDSEARAFQDEIEVKVVAATASPTPTATITPTVTPICLRREQGNLSCDQEMQIDEVDLNLLLGGWDGLETDLTGDQTTDTADLVLLLGNWRAWPNSD